MIAGQTGYLPDPIEQLFSLKIYDAPLYTVNQTRCELAQGSPSMRLLAVDQELPLTVLPEVQSAEL